MHTLSSYSASHSSQARARAASQDERFTLPGAVSEGVAEVAWEDVDEPGGRVFPLAQGAVVGGLHAMAPGDFAAHALLEDQAQPAFPPQPALDAEAFDLEAQPEPQGLPRHQDHRGRPSLGEAVAVCAATVIALGALTTSVVGGVLAFTSDDYETSRNGMIAFAVGNLCNVVFCVCCSSGD